MLDVEALSSTKEAAVPERPVPSTCHAGPGSCPFCVVAYIRACPSSPLLRSAKQTRLLILLATRRLNV